MSNLVESFESLAPALVSLALAMLLSVVVLSLAHWALFVREIGTLQRVSRQVVMLVLTLLAAFSAVLALSVHPQTQQTAAILVGLLGLALSVAMTLSSTTFMSNAMAGLMLRAVRNFQVGDFIRVGEYFGRVTERGLFHVEIQTEDRDLSTVPNMYLVSQPVKVIRESGTIVSAELSLGYDEPHGRVEALLTTAALEAGLEKPFVYLLDLGDFSITYRIAGFLTNVEHILSVRSTLRTRVLDTLHGAGIEIVSPAFMNQRRLSEHAVVLADGADGAEEGTTSQASLKTVPEDLMFDKADQKQHLESLRTQHATLARQIKDVEAQRKAGESGDGATGQAELESLRTRFEFLRAALARAEEANDAAETTAPETSSK